MSSLLIHLFIGFVTGTVSTFLAIYSLGKSTYESPAVVQEEYYDLLLEEKYGEWVPVSQALPELSGHYLVTVSRRKTPAVRGIPTIMNVDIDRYNCTANRWEMYDGYVIAWMVPPKGYRIIKKKYV